LWLDPIVSPQLASVATMLLVSILVLTNTVSADGSISGVYNAGVQLAERTSGQSNSEVREVTDDLKLLVEPEEQKPAAPAAPAKDTTDQQKEQKPNTKSGSTRKNR